VRDDGDGVTSQTKYPVRKVAIIVGLVVLLILATLGTMLWLSILYG
jgi:hypothetical protein